MLGGQLQGDRTAERDAEDGRALQSQLIDQARQIMRVLTNIPDSTRSAPRPPQGN